jgi:hypothetical protein
MQSVVRTTTTVLPGNRIELRTPDLPEGQCVEVVLRFESRDEKVRGGILEFLDSLPPGPRSARTWEDLETSLRIEREAWNQIPDGAVVRIELTGEPLTAEDDHDLSFTERFSSVVGKARSLPEDAAENHDRCAEL